MSAVYRSICNEADTFLLLVTRLAEKEIQLKLDLEKIMNRGFINIAKARYIMGSSCVTKMQLPTENSNPIQPLAIVFRKKINNNWVFQINRRNCSKSLESVGGFFKGGAENSETDYSSGVSSSVSIDSLTKYKIEFINILKNDPKSLKKSKKAFLIEDNLYQSYNDEYLDKLSNSDSVESLVSVTDPIRLFGILVPKAMKEAQLIFTDAVNLLGECATVQYELSEALHKFYYLEKVKRLIEAAATQMKIDVLTPKVYWTPTESSTICSSEETSEEESSTVSVRKSIRSVFYESENFEVEENNVEQEAEFSLRNNANSECESNN